MSTDSIEERMSEIIIIIILYKIIIMKIRDKLFTPENLRSANTR